MSQINCKRSGCKDVFHAFMVQHATYEGELEFPCIAREESLPTKLIPFSKAISGTDFDAWVHFYEDDASFERIWNSPQKYLPILKRFKGVKYWNIYRSHAVAVWLQENGIPVIANVRWGDQRTLNASCTGIPRNASIAIGSHGCIKILAEREFFVQGLEYVVQSLRPKTIIVYGSAPDSIFGKYKEAGIQILQFDSEYMVTHRKGVND